MLPEQVYLVRLSWQKVLPIADQAAGLFYSRLFEIAPETRPLFKGDMRTQGKKLMGMINTVVNGLSEFDQFVPMVQELGRRHAGYGVTEAHYRCVEEALMWTLQQGLGDQFTAEVQTAWRTAYSLLADIMKTGAAKGQAGVNYRRTIHATSY
jgi:hemoglobin-like flavoprotein